MCLLCGIIYAYLYLCEIHLDHVNFKIYTKIKPAKCLQPGIRKVIQKFVDLDSTSHKTKHWNSFHDFRISRTGNIKMSFENSHYLAYLGIPRGCKNPSGGDVGRKNLAG